MKRAGCCVASTASTADTDPMTRLYDVVSPLGNLHFFDSEKLNEECKALDIKRPDNFRGMLRNLNTHTLSAHTEQGTLYSPDRWIRNRKDGQYRYVVGSYAHFGLSSHRPLCRLFSGRPTHSSGAPRAAPLGSLYVLVKEMHERNCMNKCRCM